MIRVKQFAHVCIFTDDLEKTRAFYEDVLGIATKFNFLRNDKIIGFYLNCGAFTSIEVFEKVEAGFDDRNQINHFCLEVESIDAAVEHIGSKGVEVTSKRLGCDNTYQAWLRDSNNVPIELIEYTDRSAQFAGGDRVANW